MVKKRAKAKKKVKAKKKATTKKPFGGYSISFKGREETLEKVFGSAPIGPSVMTKKLWAFVKRYRLGKRR
ncbi:MAG: hypothetical protein V3S55_00860 [Nitrospiraceae bacterium]